MKQKKWRKLMMAKGVGRNALSSHIERAKRVSSYYKGSFFEYTEKGLAFGCTGCGVKCLECKYSSNCP